MNLSQEEEDYNLSLSKFESMLKTNKVLFFDTEEFENIIFHYLDIGKNNLAKKALKLALEQHPGSTALKLVQIEMLIYEDKLEVAERMLNELYAFEPTNEEIYIQKANIYSKKNKHEKAIELLKIALEYTDDYADVYSLIGMEYLFIDKLELAKENFIKCLEDSIDDYSALYNVVYCFDFLDQNKEAVVFLNKFVDKNPYNEVAWHQIGRQYYTLKDYSNALKAFDFATLIDEKFVGAFLEKGKTLEKLKLYEEAIESYNTTLTLDDPTSFTLLHIGKCYEKLGKKVLALKYFNKTVHEDPLLDKGWIAITDFYLRQKNYQRALYFVNKALKIDHENKLYWKRYAKINQALNLLEEAELGYRKTIEYGDSQLKTWLSWTSILQILGEFNTAIQTLLLASEKFTDNDEIEYLLAGLNFTLKNDSNALFHLSNGLQINFEHHIILKNLFPLIWAEDKVQNHIKMYQKY